MVQNRLNMVLYIFIMRELTLKFVMFIKFLMC